MKSRRILYLLAWLCALVFLLAYRQWLAWLALIFLLTLPVFSLLLSLPAMLTARLECRVPGQIPMHTPLVPEILCRCPLPLPPWSCRLRVERPLTGDVFKMPCWEYLPAEHCGELHCIPERGRVYDYLGLFSLPLRGCREFRILISPTPLPLGEDKLQKPNLSCVWKPKADGFAENHELRLYRPGDSIRHIHWKLSAKTGKLVLREPMVPYPGLVLVRLELKGSPRELDRMLGRFLWLGDYLLSRDIPFEVRCLSGNGVEGMTVRSPEELATALNSLLQKPLARTGSLFDKAEPAACQYDLRGDADEV